MKARTICCKALVDTKTGHVAKNKWGEFWVCNKEFLEMATERK